MRLTASLLLAGADPTTVARILMEAALTTSEPFDAIHNVKMLWGQLLETQRSQLPGFSWRHLAAGARVIAETASATRHQADGIMEAWKDLPGATN